MKIFTLSGQVQLSFFRNLFALLVLASSFTATAAPGADSSSRLAARALAIVFTQQPAAAAICEGSDAGFLVTATGSGALAYQWEVSTDGLGWSPVSNGALYSGATSAILLVHDVPASMTGYSYRCAVSDGTTGTSAPALLTVNPAPTVQSANIAVQVCINGSATITAAAYAGTSYQWQVNTGTGFSNVVNGGIYTGAATASLRITGAAASMEGYLYRYVATNAATGCTATSGLDTLHVLAYAAISRQPLSATVCPGFDTSFTVAATGGSAIKWQVSTNGSVWTDVVNSTVYAGASDYTLAITGAPLSMNNYRYRAVIYNALSCPVSSNTVFLFVRPVTAISTQPASATVCATNTATFGVTAAGSNLTYQWQTDNGSNGTAWTNIAPGGAAATLVRTNVSMAMNGHRFRVVVNGYCGSVTSAAATLQTKTGTWLGVTSTDWHTASNWCGGVPDPTTDVLIPAGAPRMPDIISGTGYASSLTIEPAARLTVSGGTTQMSGPFSLQGTVAYTGPANQQVLPAAHGALEIDGSGNKYLQASTDVHRQLSLKGAAKLVTSGFVLTMKAGSSPVSNADPMQATSWIVTGNGNAGTANTGQGGLQYEAIRPQDGRVLFPVGPTDAAYNPLRLENKGVSDRFTVTVNDQRIAGSMAGLSINRTWKVSEGTPGGSRVSLDLRWNKPEEQPLFDSALVFMVRSASTMIVETTPTVRTADAQPFARAGAIDFLQLSEFSLHTYRPGDLGVLPIRLLAFSAQKQGDDALVSWTVEEKAGAGAYTVQQSAFPDRGFRDIGRLNSEAGKTHYRYTDARLEQGTTYYRLKITDDKGAVTYSSIARLVNGLPTAGFSLRPSVTSGSSAGLLVTLEKKERLAITLTNAAGQLQWTKSVEAEAGSHLQPLDLSALGKGVYFITISGSRREVLTLIKQ